MLMNLKTLEKEGVNVMQLLRSEKHRMEFAIAHSRTDVEAAAILDVPERTFRDRKKRYKLDSKKIRNERKD